MASIEVVGDRIVVSLSGWERVGTLRGNLVVPCSSVRGVSTVVPPMSAVRGLRIVGTGIPGVVALGTRISRRGRQFVAVHARHRASIVVDLEGESWRQLVVSSDEPEQVAATLR